MIFGFGDHFELQRLAVGFGYVQRGALGFVGLEEIRVVIGFSVYALPGEDSVGAGREAVQGKASTLIADGFAVAVDTPANAATSLVLARRMPEASSTEQSCKKVSGVLRMNSCCPAAARC